MSYLTEHDNERLSAQFGRWQATIATGSCDEILAARAAMGAALFVLRMHYADEQLFLSIAEDPLGLQPYEVAELLSAAVGDDDENPNTIPALIEV